MDIGDSPLCWRYKYKFFDNIDNDFIILIFFMGPEVPTFLNQALTGGNLSSYQTFFESISSDSVCSAVRMSNVYVYVTCKERF